MTCRRPRKRRVLAPEIAKRLLDYDPVTGILTWKLREGESANFNARFAGKPAGAKSGPYICVRVKGVDYPAHKLAWAIVFNEWPDEIDHRDRNGRNNKIHNLRKATRSQNCANRAMFKRQKVGAKGVSYDPHKHLYRARIQVDKRRIILGRFKKLDDAKAAYAAAAKHYFKDFANAVG